jgi:hypothetical protein
MLIAVSTLSPVKTQILIPVYLSTLIVSPTSSYSLSSIAVPPNNYSSVSRSAYAFSTFFSLSSIEIVAS